MHTCHDATNFDVYIFDDRIVLGRHWKQVSHIANLQYVWEIIPDNFEAVVFYLHDSFMRKTDG